MDHFGYFCFVFVMLSYLFNAVVRAVTCWERANFLALLCDVLLCFVTFQCGVLGRVWYLIVSIPDLCTLTYLNSAAKLIYCLPLGGGGHCLKM